MSASLEYSPVLDGARTVEIHVPDDIESEYAGETVTIEIDEDQYLLDTARNAGLWLEADCRQSWSTRCAARVLEGKVDHGDAR